MVQIFLFTQTTSSKQAYQKSIYALLNSEIALGIDRVNKDLLSHVWNIMVNITNPERLWI